MYKLHFDNFLINEHDDVSCTTLNSFKSNIRLHWDWKPDSNW